MEYPPATDTSLSEATMLVCSCSNCTFNFLGVIGLAFPASDLESTDLGRACFCLGLGNLPRETVVFQ
eukprot:3814238-Lingulodinium_polyedra.AAC.1